MAKRKERHGVSGNPARRAHATGAPAPSSSRRRAPQSYVLGAALVVVTVCVLFVFRPGGERSPSPPAQDSASSDAQASRRAPAQLEATEPPRRATEKAFCDAFVAMVKSEGQAPGTRETRTDRLERLANDLVAVGVPASMSLPARTGYFEVMSDVYEHIGLELAPEAVGAASLSLEGAEAAFTAYLDQNCPV
ncbi:hypothetical protein [Nocardioides sp. SYSU D00065]|uniref:hypothetical protein n=1 Tax=Nocardioides sp. SYSU D00065 TaxID=2817378 RepID=UPI001B33017C|nr:hypothetical protein [Nocardioides sp. SYSU D00065]